ncbi:MAG: PEP-utilizing enzyme, partial [Candidatus Acidiferrales bacterium]
GVLRSRVGRSLMPRVLDVMESRSAVILRTLVEDPRLSIVTRSRLPFLRRVRRIAFRYGIPAQVIHALARPDKAHARAEELGAELRSRLRPRNTTAAGHLNFAEQVLNNEIVQIAPNLLPLAASGLAMLALAGRLLGKDASEADLQITLRGLPRNVTTEMNLALWELAKKIRGDESAAAIFSKEPPAELALQYHAGTLPPSTQQGIAEFLVRYGHRAIAEIDLGMPRWSEDPTHILGVLSNYLRLEDPELAPDAMFARGATEANAMVETLTRRARNRGRLRAKLVHFALNRARQLAGLREIPKYYIVVALVAARRELAALGVDLARNKKIENADDIFFLSLVEARAALNGANLRELVKDRRHGYEAELRRKHIPRVILSDGTEPEKRIADASNAAGLSGTPASPGVVTGIARVVLDPNGAHLEPGEILVAPSTDPGWTPLFLTAGGLVMEMGGANSHGAVVAREYGIPAVVGVAEATTRVVTGQKITVDGGGGTVTLTGNSSGGS